jgi:sterol 3beta-glucosyltransferase
MSHLNGGRRRVRITVLSFGTRGDVQPLIALSRALIDAGYDVTLGADTEFAGEVEQHGITNKVLRLNLRQFLSSEAGRRAMGGNGGAPADSFETMVRPMLDDCWAAVQGTDAIIHDTMLLPAYHMAEALGVPSMMTSVMPNMSPTRAFSLIGAPRIGWGALANRLSYQWYRLAWFFGTRDVRRWCETTLGFRPPRLQNYWKMRGRIVPVLYSYSSHVLPSPRDWPAETLASGYWFLDSITEWQPPRELDAFLAKGPTPIYVGFGSVIGADPDEMTAQVLAAIERTGQRAVLGTGWGGLRARALPPSVFVVEDVPHGWLFPRVKAVVHHGGAGTTAAALRFARPSVICPFVTDQFFWGDLVAKNGWGPPPVPQKWLSAAALAAAIDCAAEDDGMRRRVLDVSERIRSEDGIGAAVRFVRQHFGQQARGCRARRAAYESETR